MNSTEHADQEMQMVSTRREGGQQVDEVSEEPSDGSSETMRAKRTDEVSAGLQIAMATRVMKVPRACE